MTKRKQSPATVHRLPRTPTGRDYLRVAHSARAHGIDVPASEFDWDLVARGVDPIVEGTLKWLERASAVAKTGEGGR